MASSIPAGTGSAAGASGFAAGTASASGAGFITAGDGTAPASGGGTTPKAANPVVVNRAALIRANNW